MKDGKRRYKVSRILSDIDDILHDLVFIDQDDERLKELARVLKTKPEKLVEITVLVYKVCKNRGYEARRIQFKDLFEENGIKVKPSMENEIDYLWSGERK